MPLFFLLCDMVSNFRFKAIFRVSIRKVTVTPQDPKVVLRIQEEIRDLISKDAIVQIDDVPNLCLSPIFVIP